MQTKEAINISDPQSVSNILTDQHSLGNLLHHANHILAIKRLIAQILPDSLNSHCRVINLRNHTLIISADNSCWATRLRTLTSSLIKSLHFYDHLNHIDSLRITIQPSAHPVSNTGTGEIKQMKPSPKASKFIQSSAETIRHPQLKAALNRLANTTLLK